MNDFVSVLESKEIDSIVSSLVCTDKDRLFLKYLNDDGRKALFFEILKEYPLKKGMSRIKTTAALYLLAKSLGISKVNTFLSKTLDVKLFNINSRIHVAKDKGYVVDGIGYIEAKQNYVALQSSVR